MPGWLVGTLVVVNLAFLTVVLIPKDKGRDDMGLGLLVTIGLIGLALLLWLCVELIFLLVWFHQ